MPKIFASLSVFTVLTLGVCLWWGLGLELNKTLMIWKDLQRQKTPKVAVIGGIDSVELEKVNASIDEQREAFRVQRRSGSIHILMGIGSSLFVVLVCSIAVTYFIGTGRWCREVVEAYGLPPEILRENQRLKRKSFPWALFAMLAALGISSVGAAADPGTGMSGTERWVTPHLFAALAGISLISYCLYALWGLIVRNNEVINRVMREVRARRASTDNAPDRKASSAARAG